MAFSVQQHRQRGLDFVSPVTSVFLEFNKLFVLCLQVCVKTCPDQFWLTHSFAMHPSKFFNQSYCIPSFNLTTTDLVSLSLQAQCTLLCFLGVLSDLLIIAKRFWRDSVWIFHQNFVFQSINEIINKELCPYFYIPTTSGERNCTIVYELTNDK